MMKQDGISLINQIANSDNLKLASKKVYQNKGAAGIDGVTVHELDAHLIKYGQQMIEKMRAGAYQPQPVKRVSIPKDNGGIRNLGIPVVRDRVVQQAILQVIEPIIDSSFSTYSYGFRKGRNAHQAIKQAEKSFRIKIKSLQIHKMTGSTLQIVSLIINPIVRGWINYFGKYNRSELKSSLDVLNRRLVKWATCKYKRFRGHPKRAREWLKEVAEREPNMFPHWTLNVTP